MKFEWDDRKNALNIRKHGIDFAEVVALFDCPMLVNTDDGDYGEDRWIGIGMLKEIVAVVVFVEKRQGEGIRIISARKATRSERKRYEREIAHAMGQTQKDEG